MTHKKSLLSACALVTLLASSGCANMGKPLEPRALPVSSPVKEASAVDYASRNWNAPPMVKEGKSSVVLVTPLSLPENVRSTKLSLELEPGATVADVVAVLGRLGHSVILSDDTAGNKAFYVPRYEGTLGGFLSALSRVTDVWFTWHDGTIVVSSKEKVSISIPQESGFAETLEKGLKGLGVESAGISWEAGMASVSLSPSELKRAKAYLERMTSNAAVVTLQVAVVNVSMDQTSKQGIDWEGLSVAVGRNAEAYNPSLFDKAPTTPVVPTTGTSTGTTGAVAAAAPVLLGAATGALFKGSKLAGMIATKGFSFTGLYDFLGKYGVTETHQNAKLSTATGKEVELKSLTQIPYVAEITNAATTNTTATTNTGSTRTAKADDGIEVKMTPTYDAANNSVTINFKLAIKSVIAFNELKAGNQLGTLSQPTTAERSFSDVIRVRPGQTVVIGGLTYDSVSDNRGLPTFLQAGSTLESQSLKVTRQTMFVVIRPTVEVLGSLQESSGDAEYFPAATNTSKGDLPTTFENKQKKSKGVAADEGDPAYSVSTDKALSGTTKKAAAKPAKLTTEAVELDKLQTRSLAAKEIEARALAPASRPALDAKAAATPPPQAAAAAQASHPGAASSAPTAPKDAAIGDYSPLSLKD